MRVRAVYELYSLKGVVVNLTLMIRPYKSSKPEEISDGKTFQP